jgi:ATP-dependent Clp protease adaptor protein ClpS
MATAIETDVVIDEKIKSTSKEPSRYNVIFLNDDHTPMEWVVELLMQIYRHSESRAQELTMTIHTEGAAVVGTYSYEIAEQKSVETINASRSKGFPLQLRLEETE